MSGFRLPRGGSDIDRSRTLRCAVNGRACEGFHGDTLASAMLASGLQIFGRSMKFHRPRGVLSAGPEEPNALFRIRHRGSEVPLVRATVQPLLEGLTARSENCFPGVGFDFGRLLDFTRGLWPAGFYHKTFMWPSWEWFEPIIRRAAGIGSLPAGVDPTRYFHHNLHCDLLVCGAGPSGILAALDAGKSGARVVLVEQDSRIGGRKLADPQWLAGVTAQLARMPNVRVMTRTTVAGYYDHNVLTAHDRSDAFRDAEPVERFWKIRAREVVLATGAIEQPLVFDHNDRPGIILSGAVRQYLHRYGVAVGRTVLVATNNDAAYRTACELHDAGVRVVSIVDSRDEPGAAASSEASSRSIPLMLRSMVVDTAGSPALRRVRVGSTWLECDALAVSGGWNPALHLFSQAGGRLEYSPERGCFVAGACRQRVRVAGSAAGGVAGSVSRRTPGGKAHRQWVDFQHDVTVADIELAVREGFTSVEHLKRYTTVGMSVDQGKTSNLNALVLLAELTGRNVAAVGTTTFRPPFTPVTLGAIAGGATSDLYAPARRLPANDRHEKQGAALGDYGAWKRPRCYLREGETEHAAVAREVLAVRRDAGLFESSPLGKIEVKGPDAAEFLNRICVGNALTLAPGKVRYTLMLNENGIVMDDGVFACLARDHYLLSTSSANAERTASWLDEWHQCEWPDLRLVLSSVSSQWAVVTVAGPRARELVQALRSDIDFTNEAFPHLSIRTGTIEDCPARVQRVSFTGELSFELAVPADAAERLWSNLSAAGATAVGLEAWLQLRLEKGFLHVGTDTDGTTNALDVGFGALIERKTAEFIGRRSLRRPNDQRPDRRQLVGILPDRTDEALLAGAHIVASTQSGRRSEGMVTSACRSTTLGRVIGLAMLEAGTRRIGEQVTVFDRGRLFTARITSPCFYDPEGGRMRA